MWRQFDRMFGEFDKHFGVMGKMMDRKDRDNRPKQDVLRSGSRRKNESPPVREGTGVFASYRVEADDYVYVGSDGGVRGHFVCPNPKCGYLWNDLKFDTPTFCPECSVSLLKHSGLKGDFGVCTFITWHHTYLSLVRFGVRIIVHTAISVGQWMVRHVRYMLCLPTKK